MCGLLLRFCARAWQSQHRVSCRRNAGEGLHVVVQVVLRVASAEVYAPPGAKPLVRESYRRSRTAFPESALREQQDGASHDDADLYIYSMQLDAAMLIVASRSNVKKTSRSQVRQERIPEGYPPHPPAKRSADEHN